MRRALPMLPMMVGVLSASAFLACSPRNADVVYRADEGAPQGWHQQQQPQQQPQQQQQQPQQQPQAWGQGGGATFARYARMDRATCEQELVRRGVPFARAAETPGVLAPVRLR